MSITASAQKPFQLQRQPGVIGILTVSMYPSKKQLPPQTQPPNTIGALTRLSRPGNSAIQMQTLTHTQPEKRSFVLHCIDPLFRIMQFIITISDITTHRRCNPIACFCFPPRGGRTSLVLSACSLCHLDHVSPSVSLF